MFAALSARTEPSAMATLQILPPCLLPAANTEDAVLVGVAGGKQFVKLVLGQMPEEEYQMAPPQA